MDIQFYDDLEAVLILDFTLRHNFFDKLQDWLRLGVAVLGDGQGEARAEIGLEEHRGAAALDLALRHDGDPVPEDVRLLHEVGGQHDGPALLHGLQHVPHPPPGLRVHT